MTPGTLHGADKEPTVSPSASPPHTECQQPKATERLPSNLPSHKRPAPTLVPALAGWGTEGEAMKAQPRREGCLGLLFYNSPFSSCMEVPNTCGEAPMSGGHPGALPLGEPRVVGAGTWETEEGPCGWNSPNQLPLPSPQGAVSRWGRWTISPLEPPLPCRKLTAGQQQPLPKRTGGQGSPGSRVSCVDAPPSPAPQRIIWGSSRREPP